MKQTIWKFPLQITDRQVLMIPEGAKPLCVMAQNDTLCLRALVNPEAPKQRREVEIIGTGHPMDDAERTYLGSAQMLNGSLVWHVFGRE